MAATDKPVLLIIGGVFHVPASYQSLTTALESAGYEVHVPLLPSCNQIRPPNTDLYSDTAYTRGVAEGIIRSGRKTIIIAHTYDGQVYSNALYGLEVEARLFKDLDGGVAALIYIYSWALPGGSTALDKAEEFGNIDLVRLTLDVTEDMTAIPRDPRAAFIDPGVSDADAEVYLHTLIRWTFKYMS